MLSRLVLTLSFAWSSLAGAQENLSRRQLDPDFKPTSSEVKVLFLDADSTLRVARSENTFALHSKDYFILPGVAEKIRAHNKAGYLVALVSNQGGISRGAIEIEKVDGAFKNMIQELKEKHQARIDYYDYAENLGNDRKPAIGMAERLMKVLSKKVGGEMALNKSNSLMVGDAAYMEHETRPDGRTGVDFSNSDREFAKNLGVKFVEPNNFFGWNMYGVERIRYMKEAETTHELFAPKSCRGRVFLR